LLAKRTLGFSFFIFDITFLPLAELDATINARLIASIHAKIQNNAVFLDSQNQFLSKVHLAARLDANAHFGRGFTDDSARHWDVALTDGKEQNHGFAEPCRICGRKISRSLSVHVGCPLDNRLGPMSEPQPKHGLYIAPMHRKICAHLHTWTPISRRPSEH
jgi:hypothetical protein